ncbi:unnamed protein product [Pieris macdunnoughi]|uniref:Uncharacterized protein n=1 Tax=Pieris macdunnoughi TaxID=345717 RepID=A0A821WR53_9NEOP|nr:unnamed protein product [Pieris macdunnoughi]
MPRYYTWNATSKKFQRRKQGHAVPGHPDMRSTDALGRIYTVHPKNDACQELNLLENDTHWDTTIAEAIISASPSQIRTLFAIIISTYFPSNPRDLCNKYKDNMSEDILHRIRVSSRNSDLEVNEEILTLDRRYVLPHVRQFVS